MAVSATIAAVATVSTGIQIERQRQGEKRQARAQRKQTNAEIARDIAQRRQEIRKARLRRAQIAQQAELTGTGGSSAAASATGVVGLDVARQGAFQASQVNFAQSISADLASANRAFGQARTAKAVGDLATQGLQLYYQNRESKEE